MATGLILTAVGAAAIETAYQAGKTVSIPTVAFGDGGGHAVTADPAVTRLINKFGSVPLSAADKDATLRLIGGIAVINCKDFPGKTIREFGLMSDTGVLIGYCATPDTYLPEQSDSILKEVVVDFIMTLTHSESVTLIVDPLAVMTQKTSDARYLQKSNNLSDVASASQTRISLSLYSKAESDDKFQPIGNYQPAGSYAPAGASYTKTESDNKYQPIGNYQPAGSYAPAGASYTKTESDNKYLQKGNNLSDVADASAARTNLAIYSKTESDARYNAKNVASLGGSGWQRDSSTGVITQWGEVTRTNYGTPVNFPTAFPNNCTCVLVTLSSYVGELDSSTNNIRATSRTKTGFIYDSAGVPETSATWFAIGY
jgi:phage-related tail fiber protein